MHLTSPDPVVVKLCYLTQAYNLIYPSVSLSPRYKVFSRISEAVPGNVDFAIAHYRPALDRCC